ncbi:MAG: sulfurtransferase-like selenium metabolism protein YedF [Spirochaetes bacterium]|nr:sulfurtransferase-like selenium metabolism protein YedF [Spirochaetota bacterium]
MKTIDARGLSCPQPVLLVKKEIETAHPSEMEVLVSGDTPKENITRFVETLGYSIESRPEGSGFVLTIKKGEREMVTAPGVVEAPMTGGAHGMVLAVMSDKYGLGDDELGSTLMTAFINVLDQIEPLPATIIFANSGVFLSTEGSPLIESLKSLQGLGVELLSCGTCLQFYGLKDKLVVGEVSNMYTITERMFRASRVVRL